MTYLYDYHLQWVLVLAVSVAIFCWKWVKPKFGLSAASFLFYSACSALYVWVFVYNRYKNLGMVDPETGKMFLDVYTMVNLKFFAADSLAKMLIVLLPLMLLAQSKWKFEDWGLITCAMFALINCLVVIGQYFWHGCGVYNSCGGIVGNPSISLGLTVCMMPVFIKNLRLQWPFLLIITAAVFISKSSVAIGLLAVFLAMWFLPFERLKWLKS